MGLSNETRYERLAFTVNALYKSKRLEAIDGFKEINSILDGIWFSFLGKTKHDGYWLFGADSDNTFFQNHTLLSVAFYASSYDDDEPKPWYYFVPGTAKLLERVYIENDCAYVWDLFKLTEQAFYVLNRDDDGFAKHFEPLTKDICKLQGLLFNIIMNDENFYKAWMLGHLLKRFICYLPDDSFITNVFRNFYMHHDIDMKEVSFKWVQRLFLKYQADRHNVCSDSAKLGILLRLVGRHFHYEHDHKKLLEMVRKYNKEFPGKKNSKNRIRRRRVRKLLADCSNRYAEYKAEERFSTSYCVLTGQEIK